MNCIGKIYQLILYVNTWSVSKAVVRVPAKNVDNNSCQNKERRNIFLKFDSNYSYHFYSHFIHYYQKRNRIRHKTSQSWYAPQCLCINYIYAHYKPTILYNSLSLSLSKTTLYNMYIKHFSRTLNNVVVDILSLIMSY